MRILLLTQLYPPYLGGIEQHVRNLGVGLAARGHEVSVATLWSEGLPAFEIDEGVRVHRIRGSIHRARSRLFKYERIYAPPFPDPELTLALRRIVREERPQIVHAHNWLVHSFLPIKARSGAKLVVTLHDYGLVCPKWTLMQGPAICSGPAFWKCLGCSAANFGRLRGASIAVTSRLASRSERAAVDLFVPVSLAVAIGNGMVSGGLPFQVIPNFLPDRAAEPAGTAAGEVAGVLAPLPAEDYLLFIGALGPHKGVDVLLRAYAGLADPPPLVLGGYEHSGYELPLDGLPGEVVVLKNLPHAAVMEAWRRSAVALIPSVWAECCPTVAMEAMSVGRPIIASRVGGLPDLVEDGVTGLLVSPGDPVALREAIERLWADPELRAQMGAAGKRKVVNFQASTIVSRIESAYAHLVDARGNRHALAAGGEWDP